ncbi:endonuclease V [Deinococcus roseus]|nr:endonuclease V [Deinococcus roseus]
MTPQEMEKEQIRLSPDVVIPPAGQGYSASPDDVVFALDIQYVGNTAFIGLHAQELQGKVRGQFVGTFDTDVEYVPGLFAFREAPPLLQMIKATTATGLVPQILLVDGHGIAHPRRFGAACLVGVSSGLPTIGCAKETLLPFEGELVSHRGGTLPVLLKGEQVGSVLRSQKDIRPVFVSPGHMICLAESEKVILELSSKYRVCDPLRFADQLARNHARKETIKGVQVLT